MDHPLYNRLKKNYKKRLPLAKKEQTNCFRLYDKDMPEFPYLVDIYDKHVIVYEKGLALDEVDTALRKENLNACRLALKELLEIDDEALIFKQRKVKEDEGAQYKKLNEKKEYYSVQEGPANFLVNLYDYLDTGLFLDHRPLRKMIYEQAKGKKVLNLFSYTGSISVMAALAGAKRVTSLDLSKTYLDWSKQNFEKNNLKLGDTSAHYEFIQEDCLAYLKENRPRHVDDAYDIIILDPPTFSNSKRMQGTFDVEREFPFLLKVCLDYLKNKGVLYFSTNKRNFKFPKEIVDDVPSPIKVDDITQQTIPFDFRDKKIHQCYRISFL